MTRMFSVNYLSINLAYYFLICVNRIASFWPPPYNVHLVQNETFAISELIGRYDIQDVYDEGDEMIKSEITDNNDYKVNNDQFFGLHQLINKRKKEINKVMDGLYYKKKFGETNHDLEESVPWEGGFVDKHGKFIQQEIEKKYSSNEMTNNIMEKKIEKKREETSKVNDKEETYDYANFKVEYNEQLRKAKFSENTLNSTELNEDESFEEAVNKLAKFEPRNCTAEEMKGIGTQAIECFWSDLNKPKLKNEKLHIVEKIIRLILIWLLVYVFIAVPCWCQTGLCCCCCRCKFCRPQEEIDEAKKFFANNPIGVFHDINGNKIVYKPTEYEKYAEKKLEKAIMKL